ncbi:tetratricopeptide repeat-containing sensor histidine kinase [Flavobacterium sp. 316]|uniref:tetratricopeptide repeat-containing sensor histidine kinase n=1 Tax=Flavobacterium sp. 316 TaxID=1603293 RepID=UPI00069869A0|nr:tetratricopeptide repeat-containing sensor histidine kinase [Flavobacterium sp. 316]
MKQLAINNDPKLHDYCYYLRGYSFKKKDLFEEAKRSFKLISNDFPFYYKVKIYLGEIFLEQRDYSKALAFFQEFEKDSSTVYDFNKSGFYHNLGICYFHLQEYNKAELFLFKSTEIQLKKKDTLRLVSSYMDIANLYYEQYKDDEAIPYFNKAYLLSKKITDYKLKQNAALNMAVVEENRKDFFKALTYRKEYENWRDSLNNQNKIWTIATIEKKFIVAQKEKQIELLKNQNTLKKTQRNALLFFTLLLFIFIGIGIYFYRQKIITNKIILAQKKDLNQLNKTKDTLFSIVSHDLRSSVNTLKLSNAKIFEWLNIKKYSEINTLIQNNSAITNSVYNLLDNLLNWSLLQAKIYHFNPESLHLLSIVQQIEYNFRPLLFYKKINLECTIPANNYILADLDSVKIILRNLIDNAIKFTDKNGTIKIYTLNEMDNYHTLVIEDTGLGMNEKMCQELLEESILLSKKKNDEIVGTGLGIQLCKAMIKQNNGLFYIKSEENKGTKMIVKFQKEIE